MHTTTSYKGWSIKIVAKCTLCAHFSFDIISPSGETQHVTMGGKNETRALERAKEMIDMELAIQQEAS